MPTDRTHWLENWKACGTVYSLYTRFGTPPKWVQAGKVCGTCKTFWPNPEFPPVKE